MFISVFFYETCKKWLLRKSVLAKIKLVQMKFLKPTENFFPLKREKIKFYTQRNHVRAEFKKRKSQDQKTEVVGPFWQNGSDDNDVTRLQIERESMLNETNEKMTILCTRTEAVQRA